MKPAMKRVTLVTGGTGLIGGEVIVALAREGHPVRALVRATSDREARQRLCERLGKSYAYRDELVRSIEVMTGDTTREMFGEAAVRLADVGTIIHCAANTQFSEREDENVWNTNVVGARNLVSVARTVAPAARVLFVSTASVVTAPEGSCLDEEARFVGYANTYTRSKRQAEAIVQASGLEAVVLRPSIVLSRGVRDRAMARSILWAVPIMGEVGDIPVDPDAHIDIVPVDYVARAIVRIAVKPTLKHRVYHVSAGHAAHSFTELREAVVRQYPELRHVRPVGRHTQISDRACRWLLRALDAYLPFINADVCYANERLVEEIGMDGVPPPAVSYVPDLIGLISLREALDEMYRP